MSNFDKNNKQLMNMGSSANIVRSLSAAVKENKSIILESAINSQAFELLGADSASHVVNEWADAIAMYESAHGETVRDEVLANAHKALDNLMHSPEFHSMLESTGTNSIMLRDKFAGMILPVSLATASGDAAMFISGNSDKAEIFEILRVANSDTAGMEKGSLIGGDYSAQGGALHQHHEIKDTADSITFTFDAQANIAPFGVAKYLKSHGVRIYSQDSTGTNQLLARTVEGVSGAVISPNADKVIKSVDVKQDTVTGTTLITVVLVDVLAADCKLIASFDLDLELSGEAVIADVSHAMSSYTLRPHEYVATATNTVQAYFKMMREYGMSLTAFQTAELVAFLAHQKDIRNLSEMLFHVQARSVHCAGLTNGANLLHNRESLRVALMSVSSRISEKTGDSGMVGLYAGIKASNLIKSLGRDNFAPIPNYKQTNNVHFVGTLFGMFKVFEAPCVIGDHDLLCYGRGRQNNAGFIMGDAVPTMSYTHATTNSLVNRETVWGTSYGDVNPNNGADWFELVTLDQDSGPTSKGYDISELGVTFPKFDRGLFNAVEVSGSAEIAFGPNPSDDDYLPLADAASYFNAGIPVQDISLRALLGTSAKVVVLTHPHDAVENMTVVGGMVDQVKYESDSASFDVLAIGAESFQWSVGGEVVGNNEDTLVIDNLATEQSGKVVTCDVFGAGGQHQSKSALLTVNAIELSIDTHPLSRKGLEGESKTINVVASTNADSELGAVPLFYYWEQSANGTSGWSTAQSTTASLTFIVSPENDGYFYRCRVRAVEDSTVRQLQSNTAMVTLEYPKPEIEAHPVNAEVLEGEESTLSVTWSVDPARVVWRKDGSQIGASNQDFAGIDTNTLTIKAMNADNVGEYACRGYSADEALITTSNIAVVTIATPEEGEPDVAAAETATVTKAKKKTTKTPAKK